jgi:hypothetical protein
MAKTAQAAARSWKTTLAGLLVLAFTGIKVYQNPALLMDPATDAQVAVAVGLVASKDSNVSGTDQPKE